jgi:hypothetical protein
MTVSSEPDHIVRTTSGAQTMRRLGRRRCGSSEAPRNNPSAFPRPEDPAFYVRDEDFVVEADFERSLPSNVPPVDVVVPVEPLN